MGISLRRIGIAIGALVEAALIMWLVAGFLPAGGLAGLLAVVLGGLNYRDIMRREASPRRSRRVAFARAVRDMPLGRRFEAIAGSLAAIGGLGGLAFALWGPSYTGGWSSVSPAGGEVDQGSTTFRLAAVISPQTALILSGIALLLVMIGVAAAVHATTGSAWAHRGLAIGSLALLAIDFIGMYSIGVFLVPATLLTGVAWIAGRAPRPGRSRTT